MARCTKHAARTIMFLGSKAGADILDNWRRIRVGLSILNRGLG
jgi:hypothetical protein